MKKSPPTAKNFNAVTAILMTGMLCAPAQAEPSAVGIWEIAGHDGKPAAWALIEEHSGVYDGRYIRFFPAGELLPGFTIKDQTVCARCKGEFKDQRLLGMKFMYGLKREGNGYRGGRMIDVRDGFIWNLRIWLDSGDGNSLSVMGYVKNCLCNVPTWHRVSDEDITSASIPKELLKPGD